MIRVLESATRAPSAHNRQPWRFVVLTKRMEKEKLAQAMGNDFRRDLLRDGTSPETADTLIRRSRDRICQAPVVVLLFVTMAVMDVYSDPKRLHGEYMMACQSVALAGGVMLLAAHAEGLGGVWMCAPLFAQETVRQVLDLPESWEAQGLLLMGYPEVIPPPRMRLPVEKVSRFL